MCQTPTPPLLLTSTRFLKKTPHYLYKILINTTTNVLRHVCQTYLFIVQNIYNNYDNKNFYLWVEHICDR